MPISAKSNSGGTVYQIHGLDELNALCNGLPAEFNKIFQTVGTKYSKSMVSAAQNKAPVRTGKLKRSIGGSASQTEIRFFVGVHYARFVDQGTWRMAPRPFFTSTKNEQIPKLVDELNKQVATYIKSKVK